MRWLNGLQIIIIINVTTARWRRDRDNQLQMRYDENEVTVTDSVVTYYFRGIGLQILDTNRSDQNVLTMTTSYRQRSHSTKRICLSTRSQWRFGHRGRHAKFGCQIYCPRNSLRRFRHMLISKQESQKLAVTTGAVTGVTKSPPPREKNIILQRMSHLRLHC